MYISKEEFLEIFGDVWVGLCRVDVHNHTASFSVNSFKNVKNNFTGITSVYIVTKIESKQVFYTSDRYKIKNLPITLGMAYNGHDPVLRMAVE